MEEDKKSLTLRYLEERMSQDPEFTGIERFQELPHSLQQDFLKYRIRRGIVLEEFRQVDKQIKPPHNIPLTNSIKLRISVGDLAEILEASPSTISRNAAYLITHDFIKVEREGRNTYYSITNKGHNFGRLLMQWEEENELLEKINVLTSQIERISKQLQIQRSRLKRDEEEKEIFSSKSEGYSSRKEEFEELQFKYDQLIEKFRNNEIEYEKVPEVADRLSKLHLEILVMNGKLTEQEPFYILFERIENQSKSIKSIIKEGASLQKDLTKYYEQIVTKGKLSGRVQKLERAMNDAQVYILETKDSTLSEGETDAFERAVAYLMTLRKPR